MPDVRLEAELLQFTDLALDRGGEIGPRSFSGQVGEITVEWIADIGFVEWHRAHRPFYIARRPCYYNPGCLASSAGTAS